MIEKYLVESYLDTLKIMYPQHIIGKLDVGDLIEKSLSFKYEIDDLNIYKNLGKFPDGAIPYGLIHRLFKNSKEGILNNFKNNSVIPFSLACDTGMGECLEKAVLMQLALQPYYKSFIINGCFCDDNSLGVDYHAYNILFKNGDIFLIDSQNPLKKDDNGIITHPYIAPVLGIDKQDYSSFIVPNEWEMGRKYSVF